MRILEKGLRMFMVVAVAAFCCAVFVQADTWDEMVNGGADAGDFPAGDFQQAPDDSVVFDVITGDNTDGIDSYCILVTDVSTFMANETSGAGTDTKAFLWDMGGNPLLANDDDPALVGSGDFSFGFQDVTNHAGTIIGAPVPLNDGDMVILSVGAFGDTAAGDAGGTVFLGDGGDFSALVGPTGENFTGYNAAGAGAYNIVLTGAQLCAGKGKGGLLGDVNCDGIVDLLDVAPFVDLITTGGFSTKADINMDGVVDLLDVAPFVALLTGG